MACCPLVLVSKLQWSFFFFQAEDGIRDIGVTGVQTCALPICRNRASWQRRPLNSQGYFACLPSLQADSGLTSRRWGGIMGKICGTLALALVACTEQPKIKLATSREAISGVNWLMFHGDRERSGWNPNETLLTPANVGGGNFGVLWDMTAPLDGDASGNPPHLYAAPLYVDTVVMTTPDLAGLPFSVVFAASNTNHLYAICANDPNGVVPPGTILWSQYLGPASCCYDSIVQGIYGTPAIDLNPNPPRMYVAADTNVAPAGRKCRVFALDITKGNVLHGWPLIVDNSTVGDAAPPGILQNGPAHFESTGTIAQRGGLNLSLDGSLLYVPFGGYNDTAAGFMVAMATGVPTGSPSIQSAYAGGRSSGPGHSGIWCSAGPLAALSCSA